MTAIRIWSASAVAAMVLLWVPRVYTLEPDERVLRVHFVDVGQGDGILIQSPTGENIVVDAGEHPFEMQNYLAAVGVSRVALAIASHNHPDHIGGMAAIVRRWRPPFYMDNGVPVATPAYAYLLSAVSAAGSQLLEPTHRRIALSDVSLLVLPPPGAADWEHNDNSIGLVIAYGAFRLSLMGDAQPREWAWWGTHFADLLTPTQVHKSSHHGSAHGDTDATMGRLSPKAVIVSVGADDKHRRPDSESLHLYAAHGASVYRTDQRGTIIVEARMSGAYNVRTVREGAPSEWPTAALGQTRRRTSVVAPGF